MINARKTEILVAAVCAALFCGCKSVYDFGGPSSKVSPDGQFQVVVDSSDNYEQDYFQTGRKNVWVSIGDQQKILFQHKYIVMGADVEWLANWSPTNSVTVVLYDWGNGIYNYGNFRHLAASNHIASLSFALDKNTGKFVERK
jgi:hypothetical protein